MAQLCLWSCHVLPGCARRAAATQELQLSQLEGQLSRLSRDTVDQRTLLHTMQEDKEALSKWERREGREGEGEVCDPHCAPPFSGAEQCCRTSF